MRGRKKTRRSNIEKARLSRKVSLGEIAFDELIEERAKHEKMQSAEAEGMQSPGEIKNISEEQFSIDLNQEALDKLKAIQKFPGEKEILRYRPLSTRSLPPSNLYTVFEEPVDIAEQEVI